MRLLDTTSLVSSQTGRIGAKRYFICSPFLILKFLFGKCIIVLIALFQCKCFSTCKCR